ncbi:MAG: peptidylprolyl isomerase [Thiobacillaceae bacterium]|nr:peptidylprolyl isomerase [Thiobacillaceae bacterium]
MQPQTPLIALLLAGALVGHALAQTPTAGGAPTATEANKPIATVNGVAIPPIYAEFLRANRAARGQAAETLSDAALREGLIVMELLAQQSVKNGMDKEPRVQALIDFQRKEILGRALLEDYLRRNQVGEEQVKAEYKKAKERAGSTEYRVRHILVATEAEARDLIAQIKAKKAKFEDLAKKLSRDPSGANEGDLGWVVPASLVPEFANVMTALKKGQLADNPVQTRFGWHVIRLDDTRALKVPSYEEARERILHQLQQQKVRNYVRELAATAKIE